MRDVSDVKSPLNIAIVIRLLHDKSGGAERLYCELANILSASGYNVTCVYYDDSAGSIFFDIDNSIERINLARARGATSRVGSRLKGLLKGAYQRLMRGPMAPLGSRLLWQMVHGHFVRQLVTYFSSRPTDVAISFLPPANTPTLIAGRARGVRVIPTNHNVPAEDFASPARWDPNPYDQRLRLESLRSAAAVHLLFPTFAEWFPEDIRRKIVAIPNYVSPSIVDHGEPVEREKVIIAVGRLSKVKNYGVLVEAWSYIASRFPEWKVRLLGVGPESGRLTGEIRRLGIEGTFELAGHVKNMGREYARASILCHPALFEGFGLSAAEALANQIPVVAFADCAGLNQFVANDENGILVARESGARGLADALARLMSDEALRSRLGAAGSGILEQYSMEKYRERWLRLVRDVADAPNA